MGAAGRVPYGQRPALRGLFMVLTDSEGAMNSHSVDV